MTTTGPDQPAANRDVTARLPSTTDLGPHDPEQAHRRVAQRIGMAVANGWLVFLLFPLITVLVDDLAPWRKIASAAVIMAFALAHIAGYRTMIRKELGLDPAPSTPAPATPTPRASRLRPARSVAWFVVMVVLAGIGLAVGGWAMLGLTPFLVTYPLFHFSWPVGLGALALTLAGVIIGPAVGGVLNELWFFAIIVAGVGIGAVLLRLSDERFQERSRFQTHLALSDQRHRVARDVHDVLGHSLTTVILKAQVVERLLERIEPAEAPDRQKLEQAREQLAELDAVSRRALAEIRSTVGGLRSADLVYELAAARAVLADADVTLTIAGSAADIDESMRPVLGWVVRESVTNVVRHARAANCVIEVGGSPVLLRVTDDGIGRPAGAYGNGLSGLRERVHAAGAELRISNPPGDRTGTMVEVVLAGAPSTATPATEPERSVLHGGRGHVS